MSSGAIPALPPAGLLGLQTHIFQVCNSSANNPNACDNFFLNASLDSVRVVPEPVTLLLFGIAMLALAYFRRRPRGSVS